MFDRFPKSGLSAAAVATVLSVASAQAATATYWGPRGDVTVHTRGAGPCCYRPHWGVGAVAAGVAAGAALGTAVGAAASHPPYAYPPYYAYPAYVVPRPVIYPAPVVVRPPVYVYPVP